MPSDQEFAPVIPLFGARSAESNEGGEGGLLVPSGSASSGAVSSEAVSSEAVSSERGPARPRLTVVPVPTQAEESSDATAPAAGIARLSRTMFGAASAPAADDSSDDSSDNEGDDAVRPAKDIRVVSQSALARRGLSIKELSVKLTALGYAEDDVLTELDRLQGARYLDDRSLAEDIVRIESERKGKGRSAIMSELRRRGIDAEDYLEALDVLERDSERERATELAEKRIRQLSSYDDVTVRRRLHSFLSRRGFAGDTVNAAVDAAMHPPR